MAESKPSSGAATRTSLRAGATAEVRGAAASLTFLTRLPLGSAVVLDGEDLARSAPYFPLAGAAVGAIVGLVGMELARIVEPLLAAIAAVATYAVLTGALHLDGLADTFDALGTHSRSEALRVMRDPTIGSFGATALVVDLLLSTALLATLVARPSFLRLVIVVGAVSRLGPVLLLEVLPYLRSEEGVGRALARGSSLRAAVAVGASLVIAGLLLGTLGLILDAIVVAALTPFAVALWRWLGGVTGDTLGCSVELLQLVGLGAGLGLVSVGVLR